MQVHENTDWNTDPAGGSGFAPIYFFKLIKIHVIFV